MALAPSGDITVIHTSVSPNTLYYLALYVLVLVVRFFKLKKDEAGEGWKKHTKKEIFHVGLEIVYTASGLVVLLLTDLKDYAAFIILGYVILVMVSANIESMEEKFSKKSVFNTHVVVLIIVGLITIWYFESIAPAKHTVTASTPPKVNNQSEQKSYKVAIPYQDLSLRSHLGVAFGNRQLVFITDVEAKSTKSAKKIAIEKFTNDVLPFNSKNGSNVDLIPNKDQITISENLLD